MNFCGFKFKYIYGAVFIDSKIEENIINEIEDWKRYRDDSFSKSLQSSREREIEKTNWMNDNIVQNKIKFTMECSQNEMGFFRYENYSNTYIRKTSGYYDRYIF